jgi:hypothetical protein
METETTNQKPVSFDFAAGGIFFFFVLLFIVGFLGVLFLEGVARVFGSMEHTVPRGIGQFDEVLGWSLKPLSYGVSSRTGYEIEYRINSKGLRDDETNYAKPGGTFRIVLIGDSRTFGFGVPIDKHFSTLLEGYFKDVEVVNMGVGGFGVDQELLYLRSEGFRYEPDVVLAYVAHYGDHRHMHGERFGKSKPRFVFIDGNLTLRNSPVIQTKGVYRNVHDWFVRKSRAYEYLTMLLGSDRQTALARKQVDEQNSTDELFRKELHKLGEAIINTMHEESSSHGATFVLVTQVNQLHQAALKKQILSLDVSDPLSNEKYRLPDDLAHINEAGNGVLAWEIATFLRKNQLIPNKHLYDHKKLKATKTHSIS